VVQENENGFGLFIYTKKMHPFLIFVLLMELLTCRSKINSWCMRKTLFFTLLLTFYQINAQEAEEVGWVSRFGAAGGIAPVYVFPNVDALNLQTKMMGIPELSNSGMFTFGGGGYAYIMMINNVRIGGIGFGGTQSSSANVGGLNKEIKYNFGIGGLTLEYTLPFINNVAVSIGAIIGGGTTSIEIYQNRGDYDWVTIFHQVSNSSVSTNIISRKLYNTYFTISPTLNVDIPLNRFIALRVGGGYVTSFSNTWKGDNDQNVNGVPSDLTSNSFFIQTGIYFGFFAF
jgi:hypothetical protein